MDMAAALRRPLLGPPGANPSPPPTSRQPSGSVGVLSSMLQPLSSQHQPTSSMQRRMLRLWQRAAAVQPPGGWQQQCVRWPTRACQPSAPAHGGWQLLLLLLLLLLLYYTRVYQEK